MKGYGEIRSPFSFERGKCVLTNDHKAKCLELLGQGVSKEKIYREIIKPVSDMTFESFVRMTYKWRKKANVDEKTLDAANLGFRFTPHASTVQVNGKGEVVQAWVKQHTQDQMEQLLAAIRDNTPVASIKPMPCMQASGMLEAPLFDMHFGIADLNYYRQALAEILGVVTSKHWQKIVILVGQDLFHNDSIAKGVTTKGTLIDKVDLKKAVLDAKEFYFNLIDEALMSANEVEVIYSPGNHDKTVGWMFVQMLKVRYGNIVEDSARERKCIWWNGCFIGITHGDKGNDTAAGLRGKFTMDFPALFAASTVREIHVGHLHREGESRDEYGAQVRRICTKAKTDEWTDEQGYMSQKRFMLFEWAPGRLKAIHYV